MIRSNNYYKIGDGGGNLFSKNMQSVHVGVTFRQLHSSCGSTVCAGNVALLKHFFGNEPERDSAMEGI